MPKEGHIVESADLGANVRFSKRETKRLGNTWRAMLIVAKTVWSILLGPNIQRVSSSPFSVWIWCRKIIKQVDIKDIHGVFLFLKDIGIDNVFFFKPLTKQSLWSYAVIVYGYFEDLNREKLVYFWPYARSPFCIIFRN